MSPRRHRRQDDDQPASERVDGGHALDRVESGPDGDWAVRPVTGAAAAKVYRCPGCDHEIRPGTPHLVVWPADGGARLDERRHWHTPCWQARHRRGRRAGRPR